MNIGDRVTTKKLSLPTVATVAGIVTGEMYTKLCRRAVEDFHNWNKLYPEWQSHNVVVLVFDEPQYIVSFEEFCEGLDTPGVTENMRAMYHEKVAKVEYATYPEQDLELF